MKHHCTIRHALVTPELLGRALVTPPLPAWRRLLGHKPVDSWSTWRTFLIAERGEALTPEETAVFKQFTGGREPPTEPCKESIYVTGRRAGKDHAAAVKAVYLATCVDYPMLARGERGVMLIISQNTEQAQVQLNYIKGVFESSPVLSRHIVSQTNYSIELDNGIDVVVRAANFRGLRGQTSIGIIASESAFWRNENSSNPDHEIFRSIRPSLLTVEGASLTQISTPYSKTGELWSGYHHYFGKDGDVLVVNGKSTDFNPTLPQKEIDRAFEADPEGAASEYGGEFRSDISAFISRDVVMRCVNNNVQEIGPSGGRYHGFADPSGGSSDSFCFGVAHEENERIVVDVLLERRPPFSPDEVVRDIASICKRYNVSRIEGDKYAAQWVVEAFSKVGITYKHAELTTSDLFRELVPVLNTRTVLLLENARAIGQLCALERRTGRSGKDAISHPQGGHDDLATVIAGAVYLAGTNAKRRGVMMVGSLFGGAGPISWQHERGRVSLLDASKNECIPSEAWSRANNKSRYGSTSVKI